MNNMNQIVGRNIKALRLRLGLSQEEIAQDANITTSHWGSIERGSCNPTLETLASMADALHVDITCLFAEENDLPQSLPPVLTAEVEFLKSLPPKQQRKVSQILHLLDTWNEE